MLGRGPGTSCSRLNTASQQHRQHSMTAAHPTGTRTPNRHTHTNLTQQQLPTDRQTAAAAAESPAAASVQSTHTRQGACTKGRQHHTEPARSNTAKGCACGWGPTDLDTTFGSHSHPSHIPSLVQPAGQRAGGIHCSRISSKTLALRPTPVSTYHKNCQRQCIDPVDTG